LQVIKRDGDKVDFNKTRISDAIMASMDDTIGGIDYTAANDITERVTQTILDSKASSITVEAIQDIEKGGLVIC
jgi:transcriptional regulator NrdR family protein